MSTGWPQLAHRSSTTGSYRFMASTTMFSPDLSTRCHREPLPTLRASLRAEDETGGTPPAPLRARPSICDQRSNQEYRAHWRNSHYSGYFGAGGSDAADFSATSSPRSE